MLRLFPISLLVLGLILLRLCYVYGVFSHASAAQPPVAQPMAFPSMGSDELRAEQRAEIAELASRAMRAPTLEEQSAAAFAAADESTAGISRTLHAVDAAESVVVENIRNADTIAYKAVRWAPRGQTPGYAIDITQGSLKSTNGQLDVAIQGNGFFAIRLIDRPGDIVGYTRAGNLFVNNRNEIVVGIDRGYPLVPVITVPNGVTDITIGQDGIIQVLVPHETTKRNAGRLSLTRFTNPSTLAHDHTGIFIPTPECGAATNAFPSEQGLGLIQQGFLEESNVEVVVERMRLKFLSNWRVALGEAISANSHRNLASAN